MSHNCTPTTAGIADSGCTDHYATTNAPVANITEAANSISVALPNRETIDLSHAAELTIDNLPPLAKVCHLFPDMKEKALISLGKLRDHRMEVKLRKNDIMITKENDNKPAITGKRNMNNGLSCVNLKQNAVTNDNAIAPQANSACELRKQKEIIEFLAQAM